MRDMSLHLMWRIIIATRVPVGANKNMLTIKVLAGLVLRCRVDEVHFGIPSLELCLGTLHCSAKLQRQLHYSILHTAYSIPMHKKTALQ